MTSDIAAPVPIEEFLPPTEVVISDAALDLARRFGEEVAKARPAAWVVLFDWWDNWSLDGVKQAPRLGLGVYEKADVPEEVTRVVDGMTYAIMIPREILDAATERLIDVESDGTTLMLR